MPSCCKFCGECNLSVFEKLPSSMLCSLVDSRQDDKDIVLAAVKQNPAALQFASSSLRYDKANGKQATVGISGRQFAPRCDKGEAWCCQ